MTDSTTNGVTVNWGDIKRQLEKANPKQDVCPHCGYCPHCGRGGYRPAPWYPAPYWPQPYVPYNPQPSIIWCGPNSAGMLTGQASGTWMA